MDAARAKDNVAKTAHLTAWVRALGRLTAGADRANGDYLADRFLLPLQRWSTRAPQVSRWFIERVAPGGFGYFNARTRYFDERLQLEAAAGLQQLVLLGAGFDTRPFRFAAALEHVQTFEVDMPQVLEIRAQRLQGVDSPGTRVAVPIDFERQSLLTTLTERGYESSLRTLFLWEGVTYYLTPAAVDAVFATIAQNSAPGSSIVFDYVTQAFFEGDHTGVGAKQLAASWRGLGNVNRSGVADVDQLAAAHSFRVKDKITPSELEQRYLAGLPGPRLTIWGPLRIAHFERV